MKIKLLLLFILTYSFSSFSYVISKSESGNDLKWNLPSDELVLYVNPIPVGNNTEGINATDVMSILNDSIGEWNAYTPFDLKAVYTTSIPATKNKMFFTSSTSYFGAGVVAVTEISYNVETGSIASADIIINESVYNASTFTKDETVSSNLNAYLGDVFTHELGHFLGLSHSEVIGSSMIYSIFKNQHTVHSDDYSGVLDIYGKTIHAGELKGRIVGGNVTPVFGSHVMLMSAIDGKVLQSQLSKEDGSFHFKNLPLDGSYYFYIAPTKKQSSISDYYSTAVNAFCEQKSYRASFFTKCGPRSKGRPQSFELTNTDSIINVGDITIRCDQNLDAEYLGKKNEIDERELELNSNLTDTSQVHIGMFSEAEIALGAGGSGDIYTLDLRSVDFGDSIPSNYKLKLELLAAGIGSAFDFYVEVKRSGEAGFTGYYSSVDETDKKVTDITILLNLASASNNLFTIKVFPVILEPEEKYEIFSSITNLTNEISLYTLNTQVGSYNGAEFVPMKNHSSESYDDNASCSEGSVDYITQAYTPLSINNASQDEIKEGPIAGLSCATIDIDNSSGPGGSGMSFIVGFLMMLLLCHFKQLSLISLSKS